MGENMWAQICADIENHPNKQRSDETSSLLLPDQDRVSLTDLHRLTRMIFCPADLADLADFLRRTRISRIPRIFCPADFADFADF